MDKGKWIALAAAAVPVVLAVGAIVGNTVGTLREHGVALAELKFNVTEIWQLFLNEQEKQVELTNRISRIEGRMDAKVSIATDSRGPR